MEPNEMAYKIKFIVNPFSGTSNKSNIFTLINETIDKEKYNFDVEETIHAGHAITIAQECIENGYDIVIAIGGDGTVNEVASSLKGSKTALGVIPGGSGNGFAMHLGMGRNIVKSIKKLNNVKIIDIDTCTINGHFYVNVCGLGFDAKIAYLTKRSKVRGFWQYIKTVLKEARSFRPSHLEMEIDGKKISGNYISAVFANASMYGYYFTVAPGAKLTDGILDIMLIKEAPIYRYFLEAYRFLNRSLHKSKLTEVHSGKLIKIKAQVPTYFHVDGEGIDATQDFEIKINPKSLKAIVPI